MCDKENWKWRFGSIIGFGECFFEVKEKEGFQDEQHPGERVAIRRLTRGMPQRKGNKDELMMQAYVAYHFKMYEPDTEISVPSQNILFMAPVSDTAVKEFNHFWDPSNIVAAEADALKNLDKSGAKERLKLIE